jgi:hypothetical protein
VDYARERYDATFTTYDDLTAAVPADPPFLTRAQVRELARALQSRLAAVTLPGVSVSPAEGFGAVIWAALHPAAEDIPLRHLVGPPTAARSTTPSCHLRQLLAARQEAERHLTALLRWTPSPSPICRWARSRSCRRGRLLGDRDVQVVGPALEADHSTALIGSPTSSRCSRRILLRLRLP